MTTVMIGFGALTFLVALIAVGHYFARKDMYDNDDDKWCF